MAKFKALIQEIVETFAVSFIVIFLIYQFIASLEIVSGASMEPNFETGERILVDKISRFVLPYQRGESVVLIPPNETRKHYIKRIIGVPGDVFKIFNCSVFVTTATGQYQVVEEYLAPGTCTSGGTMVKDGRAIRLAAGEYVVLGDNRAFSVDSRFFGPVTSKDILGRVVFRFWPPAKLGFLH